MTGASALAGQPPRCTQCYASAPDCQCWCVDCESPLIPDGVGGVECSRCAICCRWCGAEIGRDWNLAWEDPDAFANSLAAEACQRCDEQMHPDMTCDPHPHSWYDAEESAAMDRDAAQWINRRAREGRL